MQPEFSGRAFCYRCRRAGEGCYCAEVRPFRPPFDLYLIVHPREAKNLIGSVRIAHLSCENSTWIEGVSPEIDSSPKMRAVLEDPTLFPVVLYPSKHARPLESFTRESIPEGKRLALFVIDGTWYHAKKIMNRSEVLKRLPAVSFTTSRTSEYAIRKQPEAYCLSTVEAVHVAIDSLYQSPLYAHSAPAIERPHDRMMEIFRGLIARQQSFAENRANLRI